MASYYTESRDAAPESIAPEETEAKDPPYMDDQIQASNGSQALEGEAADTFDDFQPPAVLELAGIGRHGSVYYRAPPSSRMSGRPPQRRGAFRQSMGRNQYMPPEGKLGKTIPTTRDSEYQGPPTSLGGSGDRTQRDPRQGLKERQDRNAAENTGNSPYGRIPAPYNQWQGTPEQPAQSKAEHNIPAVLIPGSASASQTHQSQAQMGPILEGLQPHQEEVVDNVPKVQAPQTQCLEDDRHREQRPPTPQKYVSSKQQNLAPSSRPSHPSIPFPQSQHFRSRSRSSEPMRSLAYDHGRTPQVSSDDSSDRQQQVYRSGERQAEVPGPAVPDPSKDLGSREDASYNQASDVPISGGVNDRQQRVQESPSEQVHEASQAVSKEDSREAPLHGSTDVFEDPQATVLQDKESPEIQATSEQKPEKQQTRQESPQQENEEPSTRRDLNKSHIATSKTGEPAATRSIKDKGKARKKTKKEKTPKKEVSRKKANLFVGQAIRGQTLPVIDGRRPEHQKAMIEGICAPPLKYIRCSLCFMLTRLLFRWASGDHRCLCTRAVRSVSQRFSTRMRTQRWAGKIFEGYACG